MPMLFKIKIAILIFIGLLGFVVIIQCQPSPKKDKLNFKKEASIQLQTRPLSNKILLRWAVDKPYQWFVANQYEFIIERHTLGIIDTITKQIISFLDKPNYEKIIYKIKVKDSAAWNQSIQKAKNKNEYLVAAQALFGKSFETDNPSEKKSFATIVNKSKQIEQRFAYALMMADKNFEIAKLAGWGFEDTLVEPNKKYAYSIYSNSHPAKAKIDTAFTISSCLDYLPLPPIIGVNTKFGDKVALISWDKYTLSNFYNAYFIERSEDSINFKALNELPLVGIENEETKSNIMVYTDSLPLNFKKYYYQIKGISSFGEIGLPSNIVSGQGKSIFKYVPNIKNISLIGEHKAHITWHIDSNALNELSHFQLLYGSNRDSCKLVVDSISKSKNTIDFDLEFLSNYFMINAISISGTNRKSLSHYIQLIDSIPPAAPLNLNGYIDTNMVSHLVWQSNKENDLIGYIILKANLLKEEPTSINYVPIQDTFFTDTLNKKIANPYIFYNLIALDKRMNQSDLSKVLQLTKPDKIPPAAPLKKTIEAVGKRIVKLTFVPSLSNDIANHKLLRKITNLKNEDWTEIATIPPKDSVFLITFFDTLSSGYLINIDVAYQIVAIDKSFNQTINIEPLIISLPEIDLVQFKIISFETKPDYAKKQINLYWQFDNNSLVQSIEIFKLRDKDPYTLWKVIKDPMAIHAEDTEVIRGHDYKYSIRVLFKNGNYSLFKEIKRWYE